MKKNQVRRDPAEAIFAGITSIILRARARAKATEALAQDLKNMDEDNDQYADFNRKEVKSHEKQASISY